MLQRSSASIRTESEMVDVRLCPTVQCLGASSEAQAASRKFCGAHLGSASSFRGEGAMVAYTFRMESDLATVCDFRQPSYSSMGPDFHQQPGPDAKPWLGGLMASPRIEQARRSRTREATTKLCFHSTPDDRFHGFASLSWVHRTHIRH